MTCRARPSAVKSRTACAGSQVEAIDLYQIHWPRWQAAPAPSPGSVAEAWETLADLKQQGKVRHIGVSNFTVDDLETAEAIAPVGSVQPPYSMLRRGIEADVLPYCREKNIGVLGYSPMLSGLLTGAMTRERIAALADSDWRRNNKEFQEPQLSANLALVEVLRAIGARHGRSAGEVAIAWTLRHPVVTAAIVGGRSAAQVDGVVGAAGFTLSAEELGGDRTRAAACLRHDRRTAVDRRHLQDRRGPVEFPHPRAVACRAAVRGALGLVARPRGPDDDRRASLRIARKDRPRARHRHRRHRRVAGRRPRGLRHDRRACPRAAGACRARHHAARRGTRRPARALPHRRVTAGASERTALRRALGRPTPGAVDVLLDRWRLRRVGVGRRAAAQQRHTAVPDRHRRRSAAMVP